MEKQLKKEDEQKIEFEYHKISRIIMTLVAIGYYSALILFIAYPMFTDVPDMTPTPYQMIGTKF